MNKLKCLKIGVIEYKINLLDFILQLRFQKTFVTIQIKQEINYSHYFKEIDFPPKNTVEFVNQAFTFEENKSLNELRLWKRSSNLRNCKLIANNLTDENFIEVKNSKNVKLNKNLVQFGLRKTKNFIIILIRTKGAFMRNLFIQKYMNEIAELKLEQKMSFAISVTIILIKLIINLGLLVVSKKSINNK